VAPAQPHEPPAPLAEPLARRRQPRFGGRQVGLHLRQAALHDRHLVTGALRHPPELGDGAGQRAFAVAAALDPRAQRRLALRRCRRGRHGAHGEGGEEGDPAQGPGR
jgi:hypothetical protein